MLVSPGLFSFTYKIVKFELRHFCSQWLSFPSGESMKCSRFKGLPANRDIVTVVSSNLGGLQ